MLFPVDIEAGIVSQQIIQITVVGTECTVATTTELRQPLQYFGIQFWQNDRPCTVLQIAATGQTDRSPLFSTHTQHRQLVPLPGDNSRQCVDILLNYPVGDQQDMPDGHPGLL